jgi:hypothetical protein
MDCLKIQCAYKVAASPVSPLVDASQRAGFAGIRALTKAWSVAQNSFSGRKTWPHAYLGTQPPLH